MRLLRWLWPVTVLVVAGCASGPRGPVVIPTVSGLPAGQTTVAEWSEIGGFTSQGSLTIRPPRLVVYADGTAIADADRTLRLTSTELTDLVGALRAGLAGLEETVRSRDAELVMDASSTVLRVLLADGGVQSVSAYALTLDEDLGYPRTLVRAKIRMVDLWRRVTDEGGDYTSAQVRLVAEPGDPAAPAPDWPAGVPQPALGSSGVYLIERTPAGPVREQWPTSYARANSWPASRLADGTVVVVAWRYLVPSE